MWSTYEVPARIAHSTACTTVAAPTLPAPPHHDDQSTREDLHQVALEELSQLPLGSRVGEVTNVESSSLCCAGKHGIVAGLVASTDRVLDSLRDGGVAQSGSNVVDGVGHALGDRVDGVRHDG